MRHCVKRKTLIEIPESRSEPDRWSWVHRLNTLLPADAGSATTWPSPIPLSESERVPSLDRVEGCLLGLALADAQGAPFEGGAVQRALWYVMGTARGKRRTTGDTQMALDIAHSLTYRGRVDPDDLARQLARSYRWSRRYEAGSRRVLRAIGKGTAYVDANRSAFAEGSYGNGAALRAPVVGLFYASRARTLDAAASSSAQVTHPHPLGIEGATFIARLTAVSLQQRRPAAMLITAGAGCKRPEFTGRIDRATSWILNGVLPDSGMVGGHLGNDSTAAGSCVTAAYVALRFLEEPFLDMLGFVRRMGGDVASIGAMAGAIWGTVNGAAALPEMALRELDGHALVQRTARRFHDKLR